MDLGQWASISTPNPSPMAYDVQNYPQFDAFEKPMCSCATRIDFGNCLKWRSTPWFPPLCTSPYTLVFQFSKMPHMTSTFLKINRNGAHSCGLSIKDYTQEDISENNIVTEWHSGEIKWNIGEIGSFYHYWHYYHLLSCNTSKRLYFTRNASRSWWGYHQKAAEIGRSWALTCFHPNEVETVVLRWVQLFSP